MIASPGNEEIILVLPQNFGWMQGDKIEIIETNGSIALVNKEWLAMQECSK
jgi:hypothetical protein